MLPFALSLSKGPSPAWWFDRLTTNGVANADSRKEVLGITGRPSMFRFSVRPKQAHLIGWREWGPDAFQEAQDQNKLVMVFLAARINDFKK